MQQLAQGIASLGRGEDKMLVHMTPGEVAGLQSLALRHGGSLTINPHTGLPEAGFLSSILPMVGAGIGIALAPATGGASLYAMGGGALGGMLGSSMEGKSPLMGGLMGGISGYGMAGLGETFAGMGAGGLENVAGTGVVSPELLGLQAPVDYSAISSQFANPASPLPGLGGAGFTPPIDPSSLATQGASGGVQQLANVEGMLGPQASAGDMWGPSNQPMSGVPTPPAASFEAPPPATPADAVRVESPFKYNPDQQGIVGPDTGVMGGIKQAASDPWKFASDPTGKYKNAKNLAMAGAPLLAMGLGAMGGKQGAVPGKTPAQYYHTTYNPGSKNPRFGEPGQPYFLGQGYGPGSYYTNPTQYAAEGGLMGGSKPDENKFYPGANIAGSSQNPTSVEVVGGYDPSVNTYTGEPVKMADGGFTGPDIPDSVGIPEDGFKVMPIYPGMPSFNPGMPPPSGGGLAGLLASQGNPEGRSQYSYTPVQQTFQKWTPPTPAAPTPAAPTPATPAPTDGGAGTYVYDPKTQQYTYNAPTAPVATTPDYYGYDPSNLGSPGAAGGGVRGSTIGYAQGGIASFDTYAAGGKLLHGPGDGMSDSIPAVIQGAKPQRAALAQGEFVIPADVVSHLGNGSTDAGSKRLYAMMDKVRHARTGNKKQGKQINADRFLPA